MALSLNAWDNCYTRALLKFIINLLSQTGWLFLCNKEMNFPPDVWRYLSIIHFDGHARQQFIRRRSTIWQRLDDGVVSKSIRDVCPAIQYHFAMEHELSQFHGIFGRTTTFGKCCRCLAIGNTRYLQHLDIINVVVPCSLEAIESRKGNGIVLQFDGRNLVVKLYYHKYIYRNTNTMPCPCPVLNAAIAYSATLATANHSRSVFQIGSLFWVDDLILEITAVWPDHVKAAIVSPSLHLGEIVQYNQEIVA